MALISVDSPAHFRYYRRMSKIDFGLIKAVVTDIDGTIIPEAGLKLDERYFDIIRKLKKAGYHVIIASGRQLESIEYLFEPVLNEIDIVSNGGLCIKTRSGLEMLEAIPPSWVHEMEEDIEDLHDVDGLFCGAGIAYAQHPQGEMCRFLRDSYKVKLQSLEGTGSLPDLPFGKVSLYSKHEVESKSQAFIAKWSTQLSLTQAGEFWIDCVMPSVNKANAILKLLSRYEITPQQLLASGDQMNDYEMLRMAGQSIAVSNAHNALQQIAQLVAENDDYLAVHRSWSELLNHSR